MNRNKKIIAMTATALAGILILQTVSGNQQKPAGKTDKEETVYALADASGSVREIIVSSRLKNEEELEVLVDSSILTDIENTGGNETFSRNGEKVIWNADGNDIYYSGSTDKELPVSVRITYYLDGQEIAPEDLSGKSGKVVIRYDYTNHQAESAVVNGKKETVCVPFTVMSAMVFTDGCVANAEVNSGKVITQEDRTIVVGMAFPGLKDSLQKGEESELTPDIPDYVEVTLDAEDFRMDMAASLVFADSFEELDLESEELDELREKVEEFSEAGEDLADGSRELADGVGELYDQLPDLADGIQELQDGIAQYTDGVSSVREGADALQGGSGRLKSGAKSVSSGADDLAEGAAALYGGTRSLAGGSGRMEASSAALTEGLEEVSDSLKLLLFLLEGDQENQTAGKLEELKTSLEQVQAAIGSQEEGGYSIQKSYEAICRDVQQLNRFYNGTAKEGRSAGQVPDSKETEEEHAAQMADSNEEKRMNVELKISDDTARERARAAAEQALSAQEQAQAAQSSAQESIQAAENSLALAGGQSSEADGAYENAVNAYMPLLSDIESTLNNIGLSKYAGYVDDGQGTAAAVAAGYRSAAQNYEAAAGSYSAGKDGYENAAASYRSAAESYQEAVEAYEETIAEYEALISYYEQKLDGTEQEKKVRTVEKQEKMSSQEQTSKQEQTSNQEQAAYQEQQEDQEQQAAAAWQDLYVQLQILGMIQYGNSETQEPGLVESLELLEESLFGEEGNEEKQGSLGEMTAALEQLYAGVGSRDTVDTSTLLGGARALQEGNKQLSLASQELSSGAGELAAGADALENGTGQLSDGVAALMDGTKAAAQGAQAASDGSQQLSDGAGQLSLGIGKLYEGTQELDTGLWALTAGTQDLASGAKSLSVGAGELSSGANILSSGTKSLASGAGELDSGVSELSSGVSELDGKSPELSDGAQKLADGSVELSDGVTELKDGAEELRDGMEELNEEGIQKLAEYFNEDIETLIDRMQAVQAAGAGYRSFSGISDEMNGEVKFIIKTDPVS